MFPNFKLNLVAFEVVVIPLNGRTYDTSVVSIQQIREDFKYLDVIFHSMNENPIIQSSFKAKGFFALGYKPTR